MQGYDENKILLLPPRAPGESLPKELLDYYKEYCSQLKDDGSFRHTHVHLQALKSFTCRCLHTVLVHTCFDLIYLCAAELKEGSDEKEAGTSDTHEEGKRSRQNDAHVADSKEGEIHTISVKPSELREYNHFRGRT